jgi:hypothetical protein
MRGLGEVKQGIQKFINGVQIAWVGERQHLQFLGGL